MTWTLNDPAKKVPDYPRFDHTKRAYNGRFIFADNKKSSEKTAALKSPVVDVNATNGACLSFWYFAQHNSNGGITVHSGEQQALATSTRSSHRWQHALTELSAPTGSLQLEIRASIRIGLIALDDLQVTSGPCPQSGLRKRRLFGTLLMSLRTRSEGDWWNARTVTVKSATQWNLVFEVVAPAGTIHPSGVMVDDVEFTGGQCPPYGENPCCILYDLCTFEDECLPWKVATIEGDDAQFEVERAGSFKELPKDHSTATEDGYYLLYRSSGVKGNSTALRLREPSRYACSSLWYFLPPMSDRVSLLLQSESVKSKKKAWQKKQFRLSREAGDAPIKVISGTNQQSFVALDDILVSEEDCPEERELPTPDFECGDGKTVPFESVCDFVHDCKDGSDERKCGDCDFKSDSCGWNLNDVRNRATTSWHVVPIATAIEKTLEQRARQYNRGINCAPASVFSGGLRNDIEAPRELIRSVIREELSKLQAPPTTAALSVVDVVRDELRQVMRLPEREPPPIRHIPTYSE
ncbi:hypothetical protein MTO96_047254, partial [Rhipicephalus appendiculatus]